MRRYLAVKVVAVGPGLYLIPSDDQAPTSGLGNGDGAMSTFARLQPPQKDQRSVSGNTGDNIVLRKIDAVENCLPPATVLTLLRPFTVHTCRARGEAERFSS